MTGGAKPPHPFLSPSQDYRWIKNVRSMFCVSTSVMTSTQRKPPAPIKDALAPGKSLKTRGVAAGQD
jgi:hypothetical protein